MELVNNGLEYRRVLIYIIAVKLDGKTAAMNVINAVVPASADAKVISVRNQMNYTAVTFLKISENIAGAVS